MSRLLASLTFAVATLFAVGSFAGTASAKDEIYTDWAGHAIKGYDPVAYFTEGKPVEGKSEFETEWKGATWRFASASNRDLFVSAPDKYAPQYGGYCAYAVAQGTTAKIEPDAWKIVDGKLYLNFDQRIKERWEANQADFIVAADQNWPGVLN